MRYLQGIITWIDSLESGRQFRSWAAILLKILGVAVLVSISVWGIVVCVDTIGTSKDLEMIPSILVIIGSILEVCINVILATVLAMLFWNRSNKIKTLDNDPQFILIFIVVITVQLFGEVSFLGLIGTGVQTLVASIFGSGIPNFWEQTGISVQILGEGEPLNTSLLKQGEDINLISGVILFFVSAFSGTLLLIVAYFIAEEINGLASIAESLNNIETKLVDEEPASDT
ncbi:MAG: hypothetical protein OXH00_05795 [Candidatus Poribacteria bacterium]|nr:hypothetical protein [Candidatus Poribacteria bacterium]